MISKETLFDQETIENVALVVGGLTAGGLGVRAYMRSMLRDRGFRVFGTRDETALNTVLDLTSRHGLGPRRRIQEKHVVRALLEDNVTVLNATDTKAKEEIGSPVAALMMKVNDPIASANEDAELLRERGYTASVIDQSTIAQDTQGSMAFLITDAMQEGVALGYREHVTKMGPMPPKWKSR